MKRAFTTWALLTGIGGLVACGSDGGGNTAPDSDSGLSVTFTDEGESSASASSEASTGTKLDLSGTDSGGTMDEGGQEGGDDCNGYTPPNPDGQLTGTVYAPNLEIPISGALVYLTDEDPEPVPEYVYCATCVSLACGQNHTFSAADGSFVLPTNAGPGQKLVVQKGQFMHVTEIDVAAGNNVVAAVDSSLPGEWNPAAGHYIPKIAVMQTSNDEIYNVLAKIGLADVDSSGAYISGTEQFDIYTSSQGGTEVLDNPARLDDYHIVFIPCMSQGGLGAPSQQRLTNIRDWVDKGGKWYVTDWANEYLYQTFPNYQTLHGQSVGDPDLGYYDTTGFVDDPNLLAWLQALPANLKDIGGGYPNLLSLPSIELEDNWSGIDSTPPVIVQDDMGMDVDVGHHAWVRGPCNACSPAGTDRPMTVSGQYGCGRMMFSTYHTNETAHSGLTPQELVLMYIILEIGVCFDEPPPPPPPID